MPGLAVALSLQMSDTLQDVDDARDGDDVVTFLNSLLLGSHQGIRNWFSQFIKAAQKVSICEFVHLHVYLETLYRLGKRNFVCACMHIYADMCT